MWPRLLDSFPDVEPSGTSTTRIRQMYGYSTSMAPWDSKSTRAELEPPCFCADSCHLLLWAYRRLKWRKRAPNEKWQRWTRMNGQLGPANEKIKTPPPLMLLLFPLRRQAFRLVGEGLSAAKSYCRSPEGLARVSVSRTVPSGRKIARSGCVIPWNLGECGGRSSRLAAF